MMRYPWTDDDVRTAVTMLETAGASGETLSAALAAIGAALGRLVTPDALDAAFRRHGHASPASVHAGASRKAAPRTAHRPTLHNAAPPPAGAPALGPVEPAPLPHYPLPSEGPQTPSPAPGEPSPEDLRDLGRVVDATKRHAVDLFRLCDRLDLTPARARELLALGARRGYRLRLADSVVATPRPRHDDRGVFTFGEARCGRQLLAVASDLHFGSAACGERELAAFVRYARGRGATWCLVPGDVLDGSKPECVPEQDYVGFERQAARAIAVLPRLPGLNYIAITGNHDEHFSMDAGFSAGEALENAFRAAGRDDWHFIGAGTGLARVDGVLYRLHHPHGSGATVKSAESLLHRKIEGSPAWLRPDVLLQGHVHRFAVTHYLGTVGVSCPSFQQNGFSVFGRRMAQESDVGGVLLSVDVTDAGRVEFVGVSYVTVDELRDRAA